MPTTVLGIGLPLFQYNYDPAVTAVGTLMVLLAVVAALVIERVVGVARLFGTAVDRSQFSRSE